MSQNATYETKHFIPELWAATVVRSMENNLVAKKVCSTEFTGEIKKHGDTVHFATLEDPTVNAYTNKINYETLKSADTPLIVDQKNYFAFKVADIESAQANVDLENSQLSRAAYKLKDVCDSYILDLPSVERAAGAEIKDITRAKVTSANILSSISEMSRALDEANVPNESKWIVIPPWVKHKLFLAGVKFSIKNGADTASGIEWTNFLGFDLYVSNNVKTTYNSEVPTSICVGGSKNAMAFADQVLNTRAMELEDSFDIGVSGLHVFGAKIIKPYEIVTGTFTEEAETEI